MTSQVGAATQGTLPAQAQAPLQRPGTNASRDAPAAGATRETEAAGDTGRTQQTARDVAARSERAEEQRAARAEANEQRREVDRELLDKSVASVQEFIKVVDRDIDFEVDDSSGQTLVRVVDPESGDLIRQLPPEEVIATAAALAEMATPSGTNRALSGLLLQTEA